MSQLYYVWQVDPLACVKSVELFRFESICRIVSSIVSISFLGQPVDRHVRYRTHANGTKLNYFLSIRVCRRLESICVNYQPAAGTSAPQACCATRREPWARSRRRTACSGSFPCCRSRSPRGSASITMFSSSLRWRVPHFFPSRVPSPLCLSFRAVSFESFCVLFACLFVPFCVRVRLPRVDLGRLRRPRGFPTSLQLIVQVDAREAGWSDEDAVALGLMRSGPVISWARHRATAPPRHRATWWCRHALNEYERLRHKCYYHNY